MRPEFLAAYSANFRCCCWNWCAVVQQAKILAAGFSISSRLLCQNLPAIGDNVQQQGQREGGAKCCDYRLGEEPAPFVTSHEYPATSSLNPASSLCTSASQRHERRMSVIRVSLQQQQFNQL